jgi:hypothetical protein
MKKLFIFSLLLLLAIGASAQSKWAGFLDPVSVDQITSGASEKGLNGTFLIRPSMAVAGNVFKLQYDELGEFTNVSSSFATRAGMGISYSHFKVIGDQPYNDYSFAAMVSLATVEDPNAGFLFTASAFNIYGLSPSIGLGYDIVKGLPFKQNFYFMWGATIKFN